MNKIIFCAFLVLFSISNLYAGDVLNLNWKDLDIELPETICIIKEEDDRFVKYTYKKESVCIVSKDYYVSQEERFFSGILNFVNVKSDQFLKYILGVREGIIGNLGEIE